MSAKEQAQKDTDQEAKQKGISFPIKPPTVGTRFPVTKNNLSLNTLKNNSLRLHLPNQPKKSRLPQRKSLNLTKQSQPSVLSTPRKSSEESLLTSKLSKVALKPKNSNKRNSS